MKRVLTSISCAVVLALVSPLAMKADGLPEELARANFLVAIPGSNVVSFHSAKVVLWSRADGRISTVDELELDKAVRPTDVFGYSISVSPVDDSRLAEPFEIVIYEERLHSVPRMTGRLSLGSPPRNGLFDVLERGKIHRLRHRVEGTVYSPRTPPISCACIGDAPVLMDGRFVWARCGVLYAMTEAGEILDRVEICSNSCAVKLHPVLGQGLLLVGCSDGTYEVASIGASLSISKLEWQLEDCLEDVGSLEVVGDRVWPVDGGWLVQLVRADPDGVSRECLALCSSPACRLLKSKWPLDESPFVGSLRSDNCVLLRDASTALCPERGRWVVRSNYMMDEEVSRQKRGECSRTDAASAPGR